MRDRYAHLARAVRDSVLAGPGVTTAALRQAVHSRATGSIRSEATAPARGAAVPAEVPAELERLVDTVTERAYEVTDQDVDELRRAGYSEDAIFEITVSVALGAGLSRLERGLAALREADDAT